MKDDILNKDIVGFLGKETELDGTIKFSGTLRVDGRIKGTIKSESTLIVGENGQIDGEINAHYVSVSGKVTGTIKAKERLELFSKAKVFADIFTPCLKIEEGAVFQGNCNMESPKPVESPVKRPLDLSILAKKEKKDQM